MREIVSIALFVGLVFCGSGLAGAEDPQALEASTTDAANPNEPASTDQASTRLVDLLFSDEIDRIDIRANTFDEASVLVQTATGRILDICMPLFDDPGVVAEKGAAVIEALNVSAARGLTLTFSKEKQDLVVASLDQANWLGEIVGDTILIIHGQYGPDGISYRDKAANLFHKVRLNPEDSESLLLRHLETVRFVKDSPTAEQRKYLN
jgi:hypothetical protein